MTSLLNALPCKHSKCRFESVIHDLILKMGMLVLLVNNDSTQWHRSKEFIRGNRVSFLTPVLLLEDLMVMCGGEHSSPDLAWSFGRTSAICAHLISLLHVLLRNNLNVWATQNHKGNACVTKLVNRLSFEKSRETITRLQTWQQDGRHHRFPLKFPCTEEIY